MDDVQIQPFKVHNLRSTNLKEGIEVTPDYKSRHRRMQSSFLPLKKQERIADWMDQ